MNSHLVPLDADAPNVLHALIRKRAEVAGKIEHCQQELRRLVAEIDHLDATIRIFNPEVDLEAIRPKRVPPRHAAFKGEVMRVVLNELRDADGPVTTKQISLVLMRERGLNPDDAELSKIMVKRVGACLRKLLDRGAVKKVPVEGAFNGWAVANL